jgi:uncharacterized protein (DUF433 family)
MLRDRTEMIRLEAKELSRVAAQRSGAQISIDDRIMAGLACVTGSRMPVQTVVSRLADTLSVDVVLDEHPQLDVEDVRACLRHAYEVLDLVGRADPRAREPDGLPAAEQQRGGSRGQGSQERDNDMDDGRE